MHDVVPVYRQGLVMALEQAGLEYVVPVSLKRWADTAIGAASAVVCLRGPSDEELLVAVHRRHEEIAITAVCDGSAGQTLQAFRCGATSVLPFETPVEVIAWVVRAGPLGFTVLPSRCVPGLAGPIPELHVEVDADTRALLVQLASGAAVADIARSQGYSTREMFRRLTGLYRRLGVCNRSQVLVWAAFHRVVTPTGSAGSGR